MRTLWPISLKQHIQCQWSSYDSVAFFEIVHVLNDTKLEFIEFPELSGLATPCVRLLDLYQIAIRSALLLHELLPVLPG